MSVDAYSPVRMADLVYYFDEDRQPHAAVVAHVFPGTSAKASRPVCNLATFQRKARFAPRLCVEPAYHNGEKWVLVNKWAWPDEVPAEEYNYLPEPYSAKFKVGTGNPQPAL